MTTLRQAAQQALEALECMIDDLMYKDHKRVIDISNVAITALRTALEQPEQQAEPVCPECKAAVLYECVACSSNNYPPQQQAEPMTEVADRFAHRMALELECVLSDGAYSNKWYKSAMQVLSEYRSAMNAIHEQHSPTFMGEPKV